MSATQRRQDRAPRDDAPLSLPGKAASDLAFVRTVLERAEQFTAVPGVGGMLMGASAIATAVVASQQNAPVKHLQLWLCESLVACGIAVIASMRKARRLSTPLTTGATRRFTRALVPPLLAGGVLTLAAARAEAWSLLVPIWLVCYGVAVLSGGMVSSVGAIRWFGSALLFSGACAALTPTAWSDLWMAIAFGGGHLVVGAIVFRRHGG